MKKILVFLFLFPFVSGCEISGDPEVLELLLEIRNQNLELKEELHSLQAKMDSLINAFNENEEYNQLVLEKLEQIQSELDLVLEELAFIQQQSEEEGAEIGSLNEQMAALNEKYEALLEQLESLQLLRNVLGILDGLSVQISDLEEKSDVLLASLDVMNDNFNVLSENILEVRTEIDRIQSEMSLLIETITNTDSNIAQILEELALLQAQCKELTELLESLLVAPRLGEEYGGGIVFYVDESSLHGLIVSKENQRDFGTEWGCYCEDIKNTKSEVGTGKTNTQEMLNQCETSVSIPNWSAKIVDELVLEGYDDWYLPSKDELNLIYQNLYLKEIGNFPYPYIPYWSSTQTTYGSCGIAGGAWTQNFSTGEQIPEAKSAYQETGAVRAIRSF